MKSHNCLFLYHLRRWYKNRQNQIIIFIPLFFFFHVRCFCAPPEKTFALLVRGELEERFIHNEKLAFNVLFSLGIPKIQIYVVSPSFEFKKGSDFNGDGIKDVDYPLSLENIEEAIKEMGRRIPPDGQLFIYLNSHGSRSGFLGFSGEDSYVVINTGSRVGEFPDSLYGKDLNRIVTQYISSSVEVILVVQACKSGGFKNTFLKQNRLVISAAAINNSSHGAYIDNKEWSRFSYSFFNVIQEGMRNYAQIFDVAKTHGNEIPPSTLEEITLGYHDTPEIHFGSENMLHARLGE